MKRKVVIAGGSGFIGQAIAKEHIEKGYEVVVLTRGLSELKEGVCYQQWDGKTIGEWKHFLEDAELLINLTGKSVDCRYTHENRKQIISSRVDSTKVLGEVLHHLSNPPKLWVNASTATIYEHSIDQPMTEKDGVIGNDFSMGVATAWEDALFSSSHPNIRKVAFRISLVLGKKDGVLPVLKKLTKFGLGGYHGNGKQRFAWIHIDDVLRVLEFVKTSDVEGPINCTTNTGINNKEFMKAIRKSEGISFGIPTPKLMLEIGSFFMGTEAELILKSRYAVPDKLLNLGFKFKFTNIEEALEDLK